MAYSGALVLLGLAIFFWYRYRKWQSQQYEFPPPYTGVSPRRRCKSRRLARLQAIWDEALTDAAQNESELHAGKNGSVAPNPQIRTGP